MRPKYANQVLSIKFISHCFSWRSKLFMDAGVLVLLILFIFSVVMFMANSTQTLSISTC